MNSIGCGFVLRGRIPGIFGRLVELGQPEATKKVSSKNIDFSAR